MIMCRPRSGPFRAYRGALHEHGHYLVESASELRLAVGERTRPRHAFERRLKCDTQVHLLLAGGRTLTIDANFTDRK